MQEKSYTYTHTLINMYSKSGESFLFWSVTYVSNLIIFFIFIFFLFKTKANKTDKRVDREELEEEEKIL